MCGTPNMQSVYVFLNYHLQWINSIILDENEEETKKKKKKRSAGNLLKPHHTLHIMLAMLLCNILTIVLNREH